MRHNFALCVCGHRYNKECILRLINGKIINKKKLNRNKNLITNIKNETSIVDKKTFIGMTCK